MNKICIIFPYFGKLPPQFKFWWQSALKNPTIDFMIFTDNQSILSEENIYVQYLSFEECRLLVQKQFSFPINLNSPYKLCDYKPAYGSIFYEYIKDFDFWGFGDIDLIYGDIRLFYTNEILEKYQDGGICLYIRIPNFGEISIRKILKDFKNMKQFIQIMKILVLMSIGMVDRLTRFRLCILRKYTEIYFLMI